MDKETANIMQLHHYLENNPTVQHLSRVFTVFHADVLYEDNLLETVHLPNTELRYQHSYNSDLTILALQPPYYNSFWFSHQDFKYEDGTLTITGVRHDNPSSKYKVTIK